MMLTGLLLSDDLLFASRITATARAQGHQIQVARDATRLLALAETQSPGGVILDLQATGLDLPAVVEQLSRLPVPPRITGYGSHVDVDTLKAARALGVEALPRSRFVDKLEAELTVWLTPVFAA